MSLVVAGWLLTPMVLACESAASVCPRAVAGSFALIVEGRPATVLSDADADPAVKRVAASFADDLLRVSGRRPAQAASRSGVEGPAVVIGVHGESALLAELTRAGKLDLDSLHGVWEGFHIEVVDAPWPGVPRALVIAGSDRRGAVFGAYDLSGHIGVSPWYWFADVPARRAANLFVTPGQRAEAPGVRYRGIFINDEAPAFSGWAGKHFGGANSRMYEHVFELLLRLKGNYLWPAMWSPRAFHLDDPRNRELADSMGVVMGTSHHEPLTRAQAEWHRLPEDPATGGAWDYRTNADNLRAFWRGALERMMQKGDGRGYENLLTIGMRGDGDEPMAQDTAISLLERIVADQRTLIEEVTGRPAAEVPQMWALYKEVQDYYDQGMRVPDDVTLLFADDNWGQIRRLPARDADRKGGFGVYYHFDYVGAPRNYKWLNTNQIQKVWQQMDLAWQRGARQVWIVNVGDIKPMEYPIDFFLRMAWAPEDMTPETLRAYPRHWAMRQFGPELAPAIAELVTRYGQLAARRKPELVDAGTYQVGGVRADALVRGEFDQVVEQWRELASRLEQVTPRVAAAQRDAFFQLVEFPILAMTNLYNMHLATAWNHRLAEAGDRRANHFATEVERAFARDAELTRQYHTLNDGKWDHMMSQVHMGYVSWNDPPEQKMPAVRRVTASGATATQPIIRFVDAVQEAGTVRRHAADYDRAQASQGIAWVVIPDLGQTPAALVSLPQGRAPTLPPAAPWIEYDIDLPEAGEARLLVHLSPTLDTIGDAGVRIGVSVDGMPAQSLLSHLEATCCEPDTPGKQRWYEAVTENRVTLTLDLGWLPSGPHAIRVWRLDDNVVLESLEVVIEPTVTTARAGAAS